MSLRLELEEGGLEKDQRCLWTYREGGCESGKWEGWLALMTSKTSSWNAKRKVESNRLLTILFTIIINNYLILWGLLLFLYQLNTHYLTVFCCLISCMALLCLCFVVLKPLFSGGPELLCLVCISLHKFSSLPNKTDNLRKQTAVQTKQSSMKSLPFLKTHLDESIFSNDKDISKEN